MTRGYACIAAIAFIAGVANAPAFAMPLVPGAAEQDASTLCADYSSPAPTITNDVLTGAIEAMGELCHAGLTTDDPLFLRADEALASWINAGDTLEADAPRNRFFRALAAIEARADLHAQEEFGAEQNGSADPAWIPSPYETPGAETAIFTVEEATAPFLGPATGAGSRVRIAIEAPGYSDLFTVYFPRGSAHLTLPAGDMVAMAAEAVRGLEGVQVWISAEDALTTSLAQSRTHAVTDVLLQNDVPGGWIRLDDGSVDAILNRPDSLANDLEL